MTLLVHCSRTLRRAQRPGARRRCRRSLGRLPCSRRGRERQPQPLDEPTRRGRGPGVQRPGGEPPAASTPRQPSASDHRGSPGGVQRPNPAAPGGIQRPAPADPAIRPPHGGRCSGPNAGAPGGIQRPNAGAPWRRPSEPWIAGAGQVGFEARRRRPPAASSDRMLAATAEFSDRTRAAPAASSAPGAATEEAPRLIPSTIFSARAGRTQAVTIAFLKGSSVRVRRGCRRVDGCHRRCRRGMAGDRPRQPAASGGTRYRRPHQHRSRGRRRQRRRPHQHRGRQRDVNVGVGGNTTNVNVGNVNVGNQVSYANNRQAWVSQRQNWGNNVRTGVGGRYNNVFNASYYRGGLSRAATTITAAGLGRGPYYAWSPFTWAALGTFLGGPWATAQPVYYAYGQGGNVYYENNVVYVNGQAAGTPEQYYQQAQALAAAAPPADQLNAATAGMASSGCLRADVRRHGRFPGGRATGREQARRDRRYVLQRGQSSQPADPGDRRSCRHSVRR